ncbi:helix-turn-helix transcriptional regulator [Mucilaginibacter paludis]|uniref:Regulatory protein LuxR n=1 Tax=Mucilaginibacter paludis DSM 18603 TaxID=714943 RepID=H1XZ35_9SPHI|nr:LuxR C-terminal-related transcriptional regulator [Mucilaginibacter paludis]EHQ24620.1 regulatory protein LuxR [Mucilaginibacter paludis DSM 18603]
MNILGTQMHWLTAVLIGVETILFFVQLFHFLNRPGDRQRLWYLLLLGLLIKFNISNGLLPDPSWGMDLRVQYMIAYGFAYLMGAYIPFYFYKVYRLEGLRFYATWGVGLFTLLPYLVFDVVAYALNNDLVGDRELGVLVPAAYGLIVLAVMLRAIISKFRATGKRRQFRCELLVWAAIVPWEAMSVFAFYPVPQWVRIGLGNLGWLTITFLQLRNAIRLSWHEHQKLRGLHLEISREQLLLICRDQGLSERIADVAWLWAGGSSKQAIGDALFISRDTVKTHISKLYKTLEVNSLEELIRKLNLLGKKLS